jgi:ferrochelatase
MAATCRYEEQLREASRLVAEAAGVPAGRWELVYQSRSGPPQQPWLEPDICDRISALHAARDLSELIVVPVGFTSDHMEVLYDLDTEAKALCDRLGVRMQRSTTAGVHPRFIRMIRELILERMNNSPRLFLGSLGPSHDQCLPGFCAYQPLRPASGSC